VVVPGAGVEIPARGLRLASDRSHTATLGALEEHVLQHVRDPGPAVGLVEEPRFHVGHHGNYRGGTIGLDQESETVGKDFPDDAVCPTA
jgi:hypothetical protein